MELPDSIKAIGDGLAADREVTPAPALFEAYDVFAAEVAHIFTRPWLAVDHMSRLAADGDYLRSDFGPRSVVLVREAEDRIHALRNACLHAGYLVCEAESGRADHLHCSYHGWSYALDGRLTDPLLRPQLADRSRFRLPRYAMRIERGLIFVDPSAVAPEPPPAGPVELGAVPADLAERSVGRRQRYQTTHNWKRLRQFLWGAPGLAFGDQDCEAVIEFGPLSLLALRDGDVALLRLAPRYPGNTDIELVQMPRPGGGGNGAIDPIGDALQRHADAIAAAPLDRGFYDWYWAMMPPPPPAAASA
jgi:nitrite reductase/ring-hydroxylating ferredoxin subunit